MVSAMTSEEQVKIPEGYKQTEVGVIPEDWEVKKIGEGISLHSGHHVLAQYCNTSGEGFPYITGPSDFSNGDISITKFTTKPTTICNKNDILITVKGSGAGSLVGSNSEYCISRQLMAVRVIDWNSKFLMFSILQNASSIKNAATGLIPGLSRSDILEQAIPIPSDRKEQTAIANALSDVDNLIASLETLITKKSAIKTAAMQQLLTGKKRLPAFAKSDEKQSTDHSADSGSMHRDTQQNASQVSASQINTTLTKSAGQIAPRPGYKQTELGEIPEDWEVSPLESIVGFNNGCAHENHIQEYGDYTVVNSKFISTEGRVAKYSDHCLGPVYKGNVLMVMSDVPNGKAIAKCYLVDEDNKYTLNQRICAIDPKEINSNYLFLILNRNAFYLQFDDGAKQTNLRRQDVLDCPIPLPSIEEQIVISTTVFDMKEELDALQQRLDKTQKIKQGMMQELLTGKTRLV